MQQEQVDYFNMPIPWQYWAVKHNPIDDYKYQIKYLSQTIKELGLYGIQIQ